MLAAKKTLTGAGATVRCQSIYIVAPAQVGQPDRGRDELTKAGNARGITEQRLPDDAGDPQPAYFLQQHQQSLCPFGHRLKP